MTATTAGPARAEVEHDHIYHGQRLVHSHPGGDVEHGYFDHPEDPPVLRTEADKARDKLRELLKPGDTVYTVLRHVSRSGMSRHIDLYAIRDDRPRYLSGLAATALGMRQAEGGALVRGGCGMDMGFDLVYSLGRLLWAEGFDCIGESCPANDHFNGDRDYSPHRHSDPGYALNQRWL